MLFASGWSRKALTNINNVNERLKAATSWFSIYGVEPALVGA